MKHLVLGLAAVIASGAFATGPVTAQVNLSAEASSPGNSPHVSILHMA